MSDLLLTQGLAAKRVLQKPNTGGGLVDWSAYQAAMQVRGSAGALLLDMSTGNGKIVIQKTNVMLSFTAEDMAALAIPGGCRMVETPDFRMAYQVGRFDIVMTASQDVRVLDSGFFYLLPKVTQTP